MDTYIRAIDGSTVTISLDATSNDLHPWTSPTMLEYAGRGTHQIIAGVREFPAAVMGPAGIEFTGKTTVGSWTIQHGSNEQYDNRGVYIGHLTAAAVLGKAFGCLLHVYDSNVDFLFDLISVLSFDEASNGMAIESQSHSLHIDTEDTSVIHPARHIGVLEAQPLTPSRLRALPSIKGTSTAEDGELFARNPRTKNAHYVVLNRTAVTTISPVPHDPEDDAYITALKSVHVAWQ